MKSAKIHLLLVEDNLPDIKLLKAVVNDHIKEASLKLKINYTTATTFEDAITLLKNLTPDVIILDLMLPDSTGVSTFKNLSHYTGDIPIIIMSGMDDEYTSFSAVQEGAHHFFIKGEWKGEELLHTIEDAMELREIIGNAGSEFSDDEFGYDFN